MSVRIVLRCDTLRGYSACPMQLVTNGLNVEEARTVGAAHGWRNTSGRDYCAGCSGSRIKPRVIVAVHPEADPQARRADRRLQDAESLLLAHVNAATSGPWRASRTPATISDLPGVAFVIGGHQSDCVARTGPAENSQAAADSVYIATVEPEVGRAVAAVLHEAFETVHQEQGLVETSLAQAAVDLADAVLRTRTGTGEGH